MRGRPNSLLAQMSDKGRTSSDHPRCCSTTLTSPHPMMLSLSLLLHCWVWMLCCSGGCCALLKPRRATPAVSNVTWPTVVCSRVPRFCSELDLQAAV